MYVTAVTPFLVDPGTGKNWLFVKVDTSDGISGWGECYTQADRDQSIVAHVRQYDATVRRARLLLNGARTLSSPTAPSLDFVK
jgi:L-alanine-DL-glutamate epimerase-like enolase superfamily enzyme